MSDPVEPLILDLLEWLAARPRPYAEVLEAWRTSCPRLPVWEEANTRGFIDHQHEQGGAARKQGTKTDQREWPAGLAQRRARIGRFYRQGVALGKTFCPRRKKGADRRALFPC